MKVNGFTGSYWRDLQGDAQVGMLDGAYVITGEARGFDDTNPSAVATEKVRIKVVWLRPSVDPRSRGGVIAPVRDRPRRISVADSL